MRCWILGVLLCYLVATKAHAQDLTQGSRPPLHDVVKLVEASLATKPRLPFRPDALLLQTYNGDAPDRPTFHRGLLLRELVRQSLLISARDELGLRTRDATLREALIENGQPEVNDSSTKGSIQIVSSMPGKSFFDDANQLNLSIFRNDAPIPRTVFEYTIKLTRPRHEALEEIAAELERLSRQDFPKVLREAGYMGKANAILNHGDVPEEVLQASSIWEIVAQFNSIRALHRLHRAVGESPQSLAALAEAYARLGTLTAFLRSPAHQALKARAMLYSQRLLARDPESIPARESSIYVMAFLGRHQAAIDQLDWLAKKHANLTPTTQVISAFVRFDAAGLEKFASDPSQSSLVRYLQYLAVEPIEEDSLVVEAATNLIQVQADCLPAYSLLTHQAPLGVKRYVASTALSLFGPTLFDQLAHTAELPPTVDQIAKEAAATLTDTNSITHQEMVLRQRLIDELRSVGQTSRDGGELSWDFLGQLIQEVNFAQAADLLQVQANALGLPLADVSKLVQNITPLISGHPYEQGLLGYGRTADKNIEQLPRFLEAIDLGDVEVSLKPMAVRLAASYRPLSDQLIFRAVDNQDLVYRDLVFQLQQHHASLGDSASFCLALVSPKSPMNAVGQIRFRWRFVDDKKRAEFESEFGSHPLVLESLARRYSDAKSWSHAERLLKRLAELFPTATAYKDLADIYQQQGKTQLWLETLLDFLKVPESGLGQDHVRIQIAEHYMRLGEFAKALPYAEKAAESWAAWAMLPAIACHEALGDNEAAEGWAQRLSERYDNHALQWYFCCRRTGFGDDKQALACAERYLNSVGEPQVTQQQQLAVLDQLQGKTKEAAKRFRTLYDASSNPWDGIHAALLAKEMRDKDSALLLLKRVAAQKDAPPVGHELEVTLAQYFMDSLDSNPPAALDRVKVDAFVRSAPRGEPTNLNYFIGKFLWLEGNRGAGEEYLRYAARSRINKFNRQLAAAMLRDQSIDFGTPAPQELLPVERPLKE